MSASVIPHSSGITLCGGGGGGSAEFLTEDVLVFRSGNVVALFSVRERSQRLLALEPGRILDTIALAPDAKRIAVATHGRTTSEVESGASSGDGGGSDGAACVRITVFAFPSLEVVKSFATDDAFPLTHLALSRNAQRIVGVSALINRRIALWDLSGPAVDSAELMADYWWNQSGGLSREGVPSAFVLQPPSSADSASISGTTAADWSGGSSLKFVSFHPRNQHEFVTGTRRALTWWKLVPRLDGRVLLPIECAVYAHVPRRIIGEVHAASAGDQAHLQKPDGAIPTAATTAPPPATRLDCEGSLAYLSSLSHTLTTATSVVDHDLLVSSGASALQTLSACAPGGGSADASTFEFTASISTRALRAAWRAGTFHTAFAHQQQQQHQHQQQATSQPSTHRSTNSTVSAVLSTATTERSDASTDRDGPSSSAASVLDDEKRSYSTANLASATSPTSGTLAVSASEPAFSLADDAAKSARGTPLAPIVAGRPAAAPLHAPSPPTASSGSHNSRKRSIFWGAGGLGGLSTAGGAPRAPHPHGAQGAREFAAQWSEEQRRHLAADALERGSRREVASHAWSPEGQLLIGTSLGELLVLTRGWARPSQATTAPHTTAQHVGSANNAPAVAATATNATAAATATTAQGQPTEEVHASVNAHMPAPPPIPALHLQIFASELQAASNSGSSASDSRSSSVALVSLAATRRFLVAGTSDGRVAWFDPSSGLAPHAVRQLSTCAIRGLAFAPSRRHFLVTDDQGLVQMASTATTGPTPPVNVPAAGTAFSTTQHTANAAPAQRPSSGGGASSSSASLFARPLTGGRKAAANAAAAALSEESKEDATNGARASIGQGGSQLRVHSFVLARFPPAMRDEASEASTSPAPSSLVTSSSDRLTHLVDTWSRGGPRLVFACTQTRELRVVDARMQEQLAYLTFPSPPSQSQSRAAITCLSASHDGRLICVGFENGYLALVDACPVEEVGTSGSAGAFGGDSDATLSLRVLFFEQVHLGAVHVVAFRPDGASLFSIGRTDNFLFFFRVGAGASAGSYTAAAAAAGGEHQTDSANAVWRLAGYTNMPSARIGGAAWISVRGETRVFLALDDGSLLVVSSPSAQFEPTGGFLLPDSVTRVAQVELGIAATALIADPSDTDAFFALGVDKKMRRMRIHTVGDKTEEAADASSTTTPSTSFSSLIVSTADEWRGHLKVGSVLAVSSDGVWLASGGRDGLILLRRTSDINAPPLALAAHTTRHEFELTAHVRSTNQAESTGEGDFNEAAPKAPEASSVFPPRNGVTGLRFSSDSRLLFSSGIDGGVLVWDIASVLSSSGQEPVAVREAEAFVGGAAASPPLLSRLSSVGPSASATAEALRSVPALDLAYHTWPEGPTGVHRAHTRAQIDTTHLGSVGFAPSDDDVNVGDLDDSSLVVSGASSSAAPRTWLDRSLVAFVSTHSFAHSTQSKVLASLATIRERALELAHLNAQAEPLERIPDASEFVIDVERLARLRRDMAAKVTRARRDMDLENVAKELVLERVRKQCWDSMEVKGCTLQSLGGQNERAHDAPPSTSSGIAALMHSAASGFIAGGMLGSGGSSGSGVIEVANFPIRALSASERARLRKVAFQRRMGVEEERWIAATHPTHRAHALSHTDVEEDENGVLRGTSRHGRRQASNGASPPPRFGEYAATRDATYIMDNHNGGVGGVSGGVEEEATPASSFSLRVDPQLDATRSSPTSPSVSVLRASLAASEKLAAQSRAAEATRERHLGVDRDRDADWNDDAETRTLWHPTMLFTSVRKRTQIHLLRNKVERLKRRFNASFQTLREYKQEVVDLIVHKGVRMGEIQSELGIDTPIYTPTLSADEVPERLLVVTDDEVRVEKRLTSAELAARELELAARVADANDEAHLRALEDMMHGTLESKKNDLNALSRELVRPAWMTAISVDLMTEEQRASVAEFDRAEKALRLERETRQRLLETELKKLRADVADLTRLFDHRLRHLFQQRLNVLKRVHREEYTMLSLVNDIVDHFEIAALQVDQQFDDVAARLQEARDNTHHALVSVRRALATHTKRHEALLVEERASDKNFRRDLTQLLAGVTITNPHTGVTSPAADWTEYLVRLFKSRPVIAETPPPPRPGPRATSGGVPGLNLTGLIGLSTPTASATDRTGLAGTLNPLLGQAGARRRQGSVSARVMRSPSIINSLPTIHTPTSHDGRKASRIFRDLPFDTNDLLGGGDSSGGAGSPMVPRPASQASTNGADEEQGSAFESLVPHAATFAARPPSPQDRRRVEKSAPAGSSNLAYVLSRAHAQAARAAAVAAATAAGEKERSDDPFAGALVQTDLDPDLGEFEYLALDPADCPFELQLGDDDEETPQPSPPAGGRAASSDDDDEEQEDESDEDETLTPPPREPRKSPSPAPPATVEAAPRLTGVGGSNTSGGLRTVCDVWRRLNDRRALKFQKEVDLRLSGITLADLTRALVFLESHVESLNVASRDLAVRASQFDATRASLTLNTELMVRMNQGLVEVEESPVVTDLGECILIDRAWLDVLNHRILGVARENVAVLREMQKFRRGIRSKQWERARLHLLHADAEDLTKELQLLRVTKSLQSLIKAGGQDNKSAAEISVMERQADHLRAITRDEIDARAKKLKQIRGKIRASNAENNRLGQSLVALHALVEERQQIAKFNRDGEEVRRAQDRRMVAVADRRHLLNLLEDQKKLMATLHQERDRLRARTYPSFAALKAMPPQMSLLPDNREPPNTHRPKPPNTNDGLATSMRSIIASPRASRIARQ